MKQKLKKQETGFAQIKNTVLNDKNLSAKAKGLYAYLYSKPNNWDFSIYRICNDFLDGERAIMTGLQELEKNKNLKRVRLHSGKMIYNIYHNSKKPDCGFSKVLNQQSAETQMAKTAVVSNIEKSNKEKKETHTLSAIADEEFNFNSYLDKMKNNKNKNIQIIWLFFLVKKRNYTNKIQAKEAVARNLKAAKSLVGYTGKQIKETMEWLKVKFPDGEKRWTLETVGKYVDDIKKDKIIIC